MGKLRHLETHTLWVQEKVRTKAISVRKVRGEVNPADLFTKHLPSKDKVHQLMGLFGCEYRAGRAESAPLLRPAGSSGQQGSHLADVDPLPTFSVEAEGEIHDGTLLPHLYPADDIKKMFPRIEAAPPIENSDDWSPEAEVEQEKKRKGARQAPVVGADK